MGFRVISCIEWRKVSKLRDFWTIDTYEAALV